MDNYAEKYASFSPYNYALNNPIAFIDPSGDTTYYYSNDGAYLGVTYDELENGVSIIKDVKGWEKSAISRSMAKARGYSTEDDPDLTIDEYAEKQRGFGKTYMVNDLWSFYDEKAEGDDIEHATFLYENSKGEIRSGKEDFYGTYSFSNWDQENNHGGIGAKTNDETETYSTVKINQYVSQRKTKAHTHHCLKSYTRGNSMPYPSQDPDMRNAPIKGNPYVVISKRMIYIYSNEFKNQYIGFERAPFKPKN